MRGDVGQFILYYYFLFSFFNIIFSLVFFVFVFLYLSYVGAFFFCVFTWFSLIFGAFRKHEQTAPLENP